MHKILAIACWISLVGLCFLVSCNQKSDETPAPAGGLLSGTVQLWDDKTNTLTDNSSVTVTVDDLTNTIAVTDATGKYSFANLPYDLHDLTFTKAGYGTYKLYGVSHSSNASGTTLPAVQLGKVATTSVTSLTVSGNTYNGSPGVSVLYSVTPTPTSTNRGYVRYFLSTDAGVSNMKYTYASPVLSVLNNNTTGGFTREDLLTAGFKSGQTIYIRLYGESVQSNSYADPNVGVRVFPNINTSTVAAVSFVLP
ncbi:carboxypeptidase-like regulatory domain-containing protein [Spirosoma validum]|uniref:Carboxypeptidase regulatory-like domain-containing protein n=1 Tax=Spirosoma validum TaxID=2771355 RepID=A0A927GDK2_9BACT|nr:carboxypeptidase-like regulatory domain-containing protein [Spirosoma validum]MBD2753640.1 carboxypeptidase regulatory-like domain-containing protein [Spirosoma validum]